MAAEDISNYGERVNADAGDFNYYAHLSVYSFAAPYCRDKRVLDAGCGAGYGAVFLARSGANSVAACDVSVDAIAFCKRRYASEEVAFRTVDLCATLPYQDTALASSPRPEVLPPSLDEHIPYHWYYGVVISKVLREERQKILSSRMPTIDDDAASQETVPLRKQSAETLNSRSWRLATPLRSIAAIAQKLR